MALYHAYVAYPTLSIDTETHLTIWQRRKGLEEHGHGTCQLSEMRRAA